MAILDFFTSIELNNGKYVGKIYRKSNNQLEYTTPEYTSQAKMLDDTRNWFANQGSKNLNQESVDINSTPVNYGQPKVATNTIQYKTINNPIRRSGGCCGRR